MAAVATARHAAAVQPQRIVSLVPSTTESVVALGRGTALAGCTRYCTEPAAALAALPRIGGTKNPSRDAILRLQPDLVLANAEENRPEDLDWLRARVPLLVQTPTTVGGAIAALRELGAALGVAATATQIADAIESELANVRAAVKSRPRLFYAVWRKPWMGANATTFVHDVLTGLGGVNVLADAAARYPEVQPVDLVAAGLDVVLLPSEPWVFDEAQRRELLSAGTFGRARLVLCDGRDFCWHGAHLRLGLRRAATVLAAAAGAVTSSS